MRPPSLEMISATVVALVLVGTMAYSVVSHEDHDHASSGRPQAHDQGVPLQTGVSDRGE